MDTPEGPPAKKRKLKVSPQKQETSLDPEIKIKKEYDEEDSTFSNKLTASSIEEDDEVWIVQCPLDMDPTSLIGETLSFEGRTTFNDKSNSRDYDIETVSSPKIMQCILPRKHSNKFELCNLNVNGLLLVTDGVDQQNLTPIPSDDIDPSYYQIPNVKLRNPHHLPTLTTKVPVKLKSKRKSKHC